MGYLLLILIKLVLGVVKLYIIHPHTHKQPPFSKEIKNFKTHLTIKFIYIEFFL